MGRLLKVSSYSTYTDVTYKDVDFCFLAEMKHFHRRGGRNIGSSASGRAVLVDLEQPSESTTHPLTQRPLPPLPPPSKIDKEFGSGGSNRVARESVERFFLNYLIFLTHVNPSLFSVQ